MPYVPVTWAYRDPGTISKLNQIDNNNVWTAERRIFGCQLDTSAANTCFVGMGKMEFGGMWLYRNSAISAIHPNVAADWEEGSNAGFVSGTSIYVVAYNDSGQSFDVKFRASGPAYSDTDDNVFALPKLYDKTGTTYFRYIGQATISSGSAVSMIEYHPSVYTPAISSNSYQTVSATDEAVEGVGDDIGGMTLTTTVAGTYLILFNSAWFGVSTYPQPTLYIDGNPVCVSYISNPVSDTNYIPFGLHWIANIGAGKIVKMVNAAAAGTYCPGGIGTRVLSLIKLY